MHHLNLTFKRGENTLIKGPSGLGKSTFFKAMANTWKYGEGEIKMPKQSKICFLPQTPSLPHATLRAVLAYPSLVDTYTTEQYETVLRDVGGDMDQFISKLDASEDWYGLSLGQKQRISFARALLSKPEWLFLDEATASLDEPSEHYLYSLVKSQLRNTTLISIAHRSTVNQFHDRVITFHTKSGITCTSEMESNSFLNYNSN